MTEGHASYLDRVTRYYHGVTPLYLRQLGKTFQAGQVVAASGPSSYRASNLYQAERAGIRPGHRVLDAGCGTCGPSIDIARAIDGIRIDGVTVSPIQAWRSRAFLRKARLEARIRVHVADFHRLPFADSLFDTVLILEAIGYSYDPHQLFAEVFRVLRTGGVLYLKDVFSKEEELSERERVELAEFDRIYALYKTPSMGATAEAIAAAGLGGIERRDLTDRISTRVATEAMVDDRWGFPRLTPLGKYHRPLLSLERVPVVFGEIKARKPSFTDGVDCGRLVDQATNRRLRGRPVGEGR